MNENQESKLFSDKQSQDIIYHFGEVLFERALFCVNVYAKKWQLRKLKLIEFYSSNLLFNCISGTHGSSVLKIQMQNNNLEKEVNTLRLFNGHGFCQVYEYSAEDKVCLLDEISPGETLFHGTTRKERIRHFCDLFLELHVVNTISSTYSSYLNWYEEGEYGVSKRDDCVSILPYIRKAKEIILSLSVVYTQKLLLHGDLHHENILKNKVNHYTAVDPKGVIGDPIFDVSRFILDEFHDDLTSEPIEDIISFVSLLAENLGIPTSVLLQCLYIETVIWLCREELAIGESIENCDWLIRNMIVAERIINNI